MLQYTKHCFYFSEGSLYKESRRQDGFLYPTPFQGLLVCFCIMGFISAAPDKSHDLDLVAVGYSGFRVVILR